MMGDEVMPTRHDTLCDVEKSIKMKLLVIACCIGSLHAWSPDRCSQRAQVRSSCCRRERDRQQCSIDRFLAADDVSSGEQYVNAQVETSVEQSKEVVYGVSFIGGDPCGSKYNVDPFNDETNNDNSFKPGLPDDMRERIAALAAEKLARTKAEER